MIKFLKQLFNKQGTCSKFLGRARTTDSNAVYTNNVKSLNPNEAAKFKAQSENTVILDSATSGLTAHTGGGQGSATLAPSVLNEFTTVATGGDSAILPPSLAGMQMFVANKGAASMNLFPATGEQINKGGANTAFAVGIGKNVTLYCVVTGNWYAVLSA
jgi:hypothetical protein